MYYLKLALKSFYSLTIYKEAVQNWRGYGVRYVVSVAVLCGLFLTNIYFWRANSIDVKVSAEAALEFIVRDKSLTLEENINNFIAIVNQIPPLKIIKDEVVVEEDRPYIILDKKTGDELAIIDTSGKYKSLQDTKARLLITKNRVVFKDVSDNETVVSIENLKSQFNLDEENLNIILGVIAQIPPISFKHGKLVSKADLYQIKTINDVVLAEFGVHAALKDGHLPVLAINTDTISYKTLQSNEVANIKIADFNEDVLFSIILEILQQLKSTFLVAIWLFMFPVSVLSSLFVGTFMILFYSFIAQTYLRIHKKLDVRFIELVRLTELAITPAWFLTMCLQSYFPGQGIIIFAIAIIYMYQAINAVYPGVSKNII